MGLVEELEQFDTSLMSWSMIRDRIMLYTTVGGLGSGSRRITVRSRKKM